MIDALNELKEKEAIIELEYRYVRSIDERDYKLTADLFHEDGTLYWKGHLIGGKPEIEEWFKEISERDFIFARHFITNSVVKLENENTASFRSYYNTLFIHNTFTRVVFGFYEDKLVNENGEWKILEKQIIVGWDDNLVPLKDFKRKG